MPAPLNVDREAARTLCVAVGVNEAARQMGIPTATMRAWSARGKWSQKRQAAQGEDNANLKPLFVKAATTSQPVAVNPADALAKTMIGRKEKSRLLLSKFVVNAAKVASRSRSPLNDAQNVRHVAAVHSAIWPEQVGSSGLTLNLGIITGGLG